MNFQVKQNTMFYVLSFKEEEVLMSMSLFEF